MISGTSYNLQVLRLTGRALLVLAIGLFFWGAQPQHPHGARKVPLISSFPWFCRATAPRFLAHTGFDEASGQPSASKGSFFPTACPSVVSWVNTALEGNEDRTG